MNAVLLSVPLIVFALVVLFGFAGCWLRTEGEGSGEETGTTNGNGPDGMVRTAARTAARRPT